MRNHVRHYPRHGEAGQTLLAFGLMVTVLMGFLAVAIDIGYAYSQRRFVQNTADLAATAGTAMLGKSKINGGFGQNTDADVANAIEEVQNQNLTNLAEKDGFTLKASYIDAGLNVVGTVGAGNPPNTAVGIKVDVSRSVQTWFAMFLSAFGPAAGSNPGNSSSGTSNEQQIVTINGNPTSGTFTLTYRGATTQPIGADATAAEVQSKLEVLPTIGAGNVRVTGPMGNSFQVTFQGALAGQNVPQMTASSSLQPAGSVSVSVATVSDGGGSGSPRRYIEVAATGIAMLRGITGVVAGENGGEPTYSGGYNTNGTRDFFPYIVWKPSDSTQNNCKIDVGAVVTFMTNQYQNDWVDTNCNTKKPQADKNWKGNSNNFRGYLHDASGTIRIGDVLVVDTKGGNSFGNQPTDDLKLRRVGQPAPLGGRPIILPVMSYEEGNGNIRLTVTGFVWVQVINVCTNAGGGCDTTGKIVRYATTGVESDRSLEGQIGVPTSTGWGVRLCRNNGCD